MTADKVSHQAGSKAKQLRAGIMSFAFGAFSAASTYFAVIGLAQGSEALPCQPIHDALAKLKEVGIEIQRARAELVYSRSRVYIDHY